jgi:hypothetical protein
MSALADDYRQVPPNPGRRRRRPAGPTGLDDKLGKDANRIDEWCTIAGATD